MIPIGLARFLVVLSANFLLASSTCVADVITFDDIDAVCHPFYL